MTESIVTAKSYAAERGISERQVIKRITVGTLSGYQARGSWYVKLQLEQTAKSAATPPLSVTAYSQQTGIAVTKILENIADGTIQGFHKQGIWYIGSLQHTTPPSPNNSTNNSTSNITTGTNFKLVAGYILLILFIIASVAGGFLIRDRIYKKAPKLVSLHIEVKIPDEVGKLTPVIKERFFLITQDLDAIADDYIAEIGKLQHPSDEAPNPKGNQKWLSFLTGSTALRSLLFDISSRSNKVNVWEFRRNFEKSRSLWGPYVIQNVVTDNLGQAHFYSIPAQDYWVMGWTETRVGLGFWKYKITLKHEKHKLLLTANNATYFK